MSIGHPVPDGCHGPGAGRPAPGGGCLAPGFSDPVPGRGISGAWAYPDISESSRPPLYAERISAKDTENLEDLCGRHGAPEFPRDFKSSYAILPRDRVGRPGHTLVADKDCPVLPIFSRSGRSSKMGSEIGNPYP